MKKYLVYLKGKVDALSIDADQYVKGDDFVTFWSDSEMVLDVKVEEISYIKWSI